MAENNLKIVMYPWFAMGHLTSFLHISNKFAERGHKIFFILPQKTQPRLNQFNLHPNLITFIPIIVPPVEGLPHETETTSDIPFPLFSHLRHAMDLTRPLIESLLKELNPHFVFYDFTHWLPSLARDLGIKSIHYCTISPAAVGYLFRDESSIDSFTKPPPNFPSLRIKLYEHEARAINYVNNKKEFGCGIKFVQRMLIATKTCDAIAFKTCEEIEGSYCNFLEMKFKKPVILAGPVLPEQPTSTLDEKWANWLDQFRSKSVIYCAFGKLVLGFELIGLPFLVALKPPIEVETIEEALPKGFIERTSKRGVVYGGWVQQQLILSHPSVGCFVTHCGYGSLSEAMTNECRLVLMPHAGDQFINARLMGGDLRVGVEVEKGDGNGLFTKESLVKAIRLAMERDSEIGNEVGVNHAKWRDFLLSEGLESSYIHRFLNKMQNLLLD
ncbi:hypothetical protein ACJIZ3_013244 [Penstemon smallii]|uniref:Glycosyltransferase n=1 Tax=Penstemon smallii TaxID=265156 RepID=A0ABD3USX5_9LAMI